jgi:hypothetical protein
MGAADIAHILRLIVPAQPLADTLGQAAYDLGYGLAQFQGGAVTGGLFLSFPNARLGENLSDVR